jgi:hypothetical protein
MRAMAAISGIPLAGVDAHNMGSVSGIHLGCTYCDLDKKDHLLDHGLHPIFVEMNLL